MGKNEALEKAILKIVSHKTAVIVIGKNTVKSYGKIWDA